MSVISYTFWETITDQLKIKYKKQYFTPEQLITVTNPLQCLTVTEGIDKFFGTRVCNIFIVALPIGWRKSGLDWVADWPPTGYADAKARHIEAFPYFSSYKTHVYMDYNIVAKVEAEDPDTDFRMLMDGTKGYMQEMCTDLAAYGFTLEADITEEVPASHFYDVLNAGYGLT